MTNKLKMKLLIITDAWHPQVNGVVRTYEHIIEHLITMGHEVKVISPTDFPLRVPLIGYREIELAIAPYQRLKKMIEDYAPTNIHLSTEGPLGWAGRKYCLKHGHTYSSSYHTQFPDYIAKRASRFLPFFYSGIHELAKKYVRKFHGTSNAMMVATDSLEQTLQSWGFKNPIFRLTRGANLDQFSIGKKTRFKDLKKPIALYVGRIAIEKNIEDFLAMDWDGTKIIIGEGPSLKELKAQYPGAHFLGKKTGTELTECYRSADLFVFPSRTDTFGIVLVEALACGLPIAAYNVTGPKDIITENFLGALTETDLGAAAQKALNCGVPQDRENHVKAHYTWEKTAQQFEKIQLAENYRKPR